MKRNAFFQLVQKEDGLYLKSYPAVEGGDNLSVDDVRTYLEKKKIMDVILNDIVDFVNESKQTVNAEKKILDDQFLPEKEYPIFTINKDKKMAKVRLYPPSNRGNRLSIQELRDLIEQNGIKYGIIEKNIEIILKARLYCTDVLIARAKPPIQGKDAKITYHFDVDKTCKPAMIEDGSVDFHKLDMIEPVTEGQLLATLQPADFGTPGIDVMGNPLKPIKVNQLFLKGSNNIHFSEDKTEMYSDVTGNVSLVNETVFVSNLYDISTDVGPSTGDIDYDGSILVRGNVLSGYSIKATGDVTVNGVVEGAKINAGGKIIIKQGIQGMGKAELTSGGDVISNFIESAKVNAGGGIQTEAIMHSQIIAQQDIRVLGKRGMIAGGSVRTKSKIEMKNAGSTMGTATELEVGIDPVILERCHIIEKEMEQLATEKDSLMQTLAILKKRLQKKGKLEDEKMKTLKNIGVRMKEIEAISEKNSEEYDQLEKELEEHSDGCIIVEGIAYPGVRMTISSVSTNIQTITQHSRFVRDGADVRIRAI